MNTKQITLCYQSPTVTGSLYNAYVNGKFALAMDISATDRQAELVTAARLASRRLTGQTMQGRLVKGQEAANRAGHYVWTIASR
jgi:hypothetical protein